MLFDPLSKLATLDAENGAGGGAGGQSGTDPKSGAEGNAGGDAGAQDSPKPEVTADAENDDLTESVQKRLKKANDEAASYRVKLREAEKKLEDQAAAALAEQGKYKELYEGLKPKAEALEALQAENERYKQQFATMAETRLKNAPDYVQALLQKSDPLEALAYLDEHGHKWAAKPAPDMDAGKKTGAPGKDYAGSEEHLREVRKRFRLG